MAVSAWSDLSPLSSLTLSKSFLSGQPYCSFHLTSSTQEYLLLVNRIYIELIIIIREGFIIFASAKVRTEFIRGGGTRLEMRKLSITTINHFEFEFEFGGLERSIKK